MPTRNRVRKESLQIAVRSRPAAGRSTPGQVRLQAPAAAVQGPLHSGRALRRPHHEGRDPAEVWDADTFVDFEHGLNFCIRQIRAALRDDANQPIYIETVPKRGYRFIASVKAEAAPEPSVNVPQSLSPFSPSVPAASAPQPTAVNVVAAEEDRQANSGDGLQLRLRHQLRLGARWPAPLSAVDQGRRCGGVLTTVMELTGRGEQVCEVGAGTQ